MRETTLLLGLIVAVLIIGALYLFLEMYSVSDETAAPQPVDLTEFSIYMHRLGCVPDCASYAVLAKGSGDLEFEGVTNVAHVGEANESVTESQLQLLFIEIYKSGLLQMQADHVQGMPGCLNAEPNMDHLTFGATVGGETRVITYYLGCEQKLPGLKELGENIDEILNTQRWIEVAGSDSDG